ncbi:MAG: SRPBCC domain-containing protein [Armatimonadetes bacterium]|nr:SRPBCC domain-containing protein [Armatimonadota bacterium]
MKGNTVFVEREFTHPIKTVFRAFVDPEILPKWIAPDGFECVEALFEPFVGGKTRTVFRNTDGVDAVTEGVITEFVVNQVISMEFQIEFGDFSLDGLRNTWHFYETGSGVRVTFETNVPEGEFAEGCATSTNQSFDNLEKVL